MERRTLGRQGLTVSAMGLGCMGMSEFYGPGNDAESIATIHRALELGIGFVAYSPLGRGFLTARFKTFDDLPADDFRRGNPHADMTPIHR